MAAFDTAADDYDRNFTATLIGTAMRRAVWQRCAEHFAPGIRVLEMNCGTGEDAIWLAQRGINVLATDASPAMLRVAQAKAAALHAGQALQFRQLSWESLGTSVAECFDGALSNFGGLNCVADLPACAHALSERLRPGAVAILCLMGPFVPWEWIWFLARGSPARAFRRLGGKSTLWRGLEIRYPSIGTTRQAFSAQFRVLRVSALGALLPPPYTESVLGRWPRAIRLLNGLERRLETVWPLPGLADHYVIELQRC